jgi:hypothetical protein
MKLDSPLFDRIRVKPGDDRTRRTHTACCEWAGCAQAGTHRAPKGRHQEGQYWRFCLDHVRAYNQSYNYFAGMTDDAVYAYQKDALTGHRPTWKMGAKSGGPPGGTHGAAGAGFRAAGYGDPFGFGTEFGESVAAERPEAEGRVIRTAERRALEVMGLEMSADAGEIKARFKTLVKLHHPDANGGDRSAEDRLRNVIQAYNSLKQAGFC